MKTLCILMFFSYASSETNFSTNENITLRGSQQPNSQRCELPPYPKNGGYSVAGKSDAKPGDLFDAAQLQVTCNPGYRTVGNSIVYCVFGAWSQDLPQCIRHCKLKPHPSVKYRCQVIDKDTDETFFRECQEYEPTGTIVKPKCNEPNYYHTGLLSLMTCVEGRWNYVATCQPQCGTVTPDGKPLVIGGQKAERGEFPWHAGIYRKDISPYKLICGGSLVSNTVVISAAHCFWKRHENRIQSKNSFAVALGKFYRDWNNSIDSDMQKFDVAAIKIPPRYQDGYSNFQDDIAVVVLSKPAVFNPFVRPVCLDFDPDFDALQLREGNYGKVAGWGIEDLAGTPSPVLQVLNLPYVKIDRCIQEAPASFRPFITSDKICAGFTNGSAVCQGDSGGGLVFSARIRAVHRFYLRGVVSTAPESQYACNAYDRTMFTKITKHRDFIEKNTLLSGYAQTEREHQCVLPPFPINGNYTVFGITDAQPGESVASAQLQITCKTGYEVDKDVKPSCLDGRWTEEVPNCVPELECGRTVKKFRVKRVVGGQIVELGEMPWNVGVYKKTRDPYEQICGGSIIQKSLVLSAARCFWNDKNSIQLSVKDFAVAAGKVLKDWIAVLDYDELDRYVQRSDISEIHIPRRFRGKLTNFQDDIALLKLQTLVKFNDYIRPICLDFDPDIRNKHLQKGYMGKIAGWGLIDEKGNPSNHLNVVNLPNIEIDECLNISPPEFIERLTSDKICAGYINGTKALCAGDTGAGLVFNEPDHYKPGRDRYFLRGIASSSPKNDKPCNVHTFTAFTDISKHEDFIKKFL